MCHLSPAHAAVHGTQPIQCALLPVNDKEHTRGNGDGAGANAHQCVKGGGGANIRTEGGGGVWSVFRHTIGLHLKGKPPAVGGNPTTVGGGEPTAGVE